MRKLNYILLLTITLLALIMSGCTSNSYTNEDYQASIRMMDATFKPSTQQGIKEGKILIAYYNENKDYYCVSTYNRTSKEIASFEVHETCHALIKKDYVHFCSEVKRVEA